MLVCFACCFIHFDPLLSVDLTHSLIWLNDKFGLLLNIRSSLHGAERLLRSKKLLRESKECMRARNNIQHEVLDVKVHARLPLQDEPVSDAVTDAPCADPGAHKNVRSQEKLAEPVIGGMRCKWAN